MGHDVLKKLERYFLLDCIAQGGMAEIFRACLASVDDANRLLIIKRILPGFGKNVEFQKMFKSEIKVMMAFSHPNIVQLYDFGEAKDQPYIAMEYVDGKNLRQFISKFAERGEAMPVELAVYVIEQAAQGLHYAHTFKDKISGEPLSLVHRDISPQNLLISYDGGVKVIDFGIAKADTQAESTRVGIIKGKPSYLSPEQIAGQVLDGRSDVFALGIVLWEALTGKKLFAAPSGENEFAVLKLIESVTTHAKPPSTVNPQIPKDLDQIVMRALSKDRDKRYQSAEELQRALRKFLNVNFSDTGGSELSTFAKTLFQNDIVEDRKTLQRLMARAESLLGAGEHSLIEKAAQTSPSLAHLTEGTFTFVDPNASKRRPTGAEDRLDGTGFGEVKLEIDRKPTAPLKRVERAQSALNRVESPVVKRMRTMEIETQRRGSGSVVRVLLAATAVIGAIIVGAPYLRNLRTDSTQSATDLPRAPALTQQRESGSSILLDLRIKPGAAGSTIMLGGRMLDENNLRTSVPLDQPLKLVIERPRYRRVEREFALTSAQYGGLSEAVVEIELVPQQFGTLTVHSTPSADAIVRSLDFPNEAAVQWTSPIEAQKLPAGRYSVKLENKVLGMSKTVSPVVVEEGRPTIIDERLNFGN